MDNHIKERKLLTGGLDFDSQDQFVEEGDYRYAMNCRNYDFRNGRMGAITNVKGNTLVYFELPDGVNTVIGRCNWIEERSILYFIHNSNTDHCILQYDTVSNQIHKVFYEESVLGFDLSYLIHHANIIDGILFWTDGNQPQRKTDIDRAKQYTAGTGGYNQVNEDVITVGAIPPRNRPIVSLDLSTSSTSLARKPYQFAYSFVYGGGEESVLSAFSHVVVSDGQLGFLVQIKTGSFDCVAVHFYLRESETDSMRLVKIINKEDSSGNKVIDDDEDYIFTITERLSGEGLTIDDTFRNSYQIPVRSFCQEVVDHNQIVYANNEYGFDYEVDLDVVLSPLRVRYNLSADGYLFADSLNIIPVPYRYNSQGFPVSYGGVTLPPQTSALSFRYDDISEDFYLTVVVDDVRYYKYFNHPFSVSLYDEVRGYLISIGVSSIDIGTDGSFLTVISRNQLVRDFFCFTDPGGESHVGSSFLNNRFYHIEDNGISLGLNTGFKQGESAAFGIVYKDGLKRSNGVYTDDSMVVNIPRPTYGRLVSGSEKYYVEFEVNHTPPSWAHTWQFVILDQGFSFAQAFAASSEMGAEGIPIKGQLIDWDYQKGDRVFLKFSNDNVSDGSIEEWDVSEGFFKPDGYSSGFSNDVFIEVYRVTTTVEGSDLWREVGDEMLIKNAGTASREHVCNTTMFPTGSIEGLKKGVIANADYYGIPESQIAGGEVIRLANKGKFHSEIKKMNSIHLPTNMIHGGKYFDNTEINNLYNFLTVNQEILSEEFGSINRIVLVGDVLKVLQDSKVTSIYISSAGFVTPDGQQQIQSSKLLGYIKPSTERWGCIDPGSVVSNGRHLYFLDRLNRAFVRDAPNGPFPISQYRASSKIEQMCDLVKDGYIPISGFNYDLRELNVSLYKSITDSHDVGFEVRQVPSSSGTVFAWFLIFDSAEDMRYIAKDDRISLSYIGSSQGYADENVRVVQRTSDTEIRIEDPVFSQPSDPDQVITVSHIRLIGETLTFFENENKWKTQMNYVPEFYAQLGSVFLTFKKGGLWIQDSNEVRNNFFGVQYKQEFTFLGNSAIGQLKTFDVLAVYSNRKWSAPESGDIFILPTENYPNGMSSRLKEGKFVAKEGVYQADFLRDINTPNTQNPVLNGRRLRGEVVQVKLQNSETKEVYLTEVIVYSKPSQISN